LSGRDSESGGDGDRGEGGGVYGRHYSVWAPRKVFKRYYGKRRKKLKKKKSLLARGGGTTKLPARILG